jgi:hypothetical protein
MQPNDIITAGVGTDGRTWVVLSDGSRWEHRFDEAWGWERVHRGLPGAAWTPTSTDKPDRARGGPLEGLLNALAGPPPVVRDRDGTEARA